MMTDEERKKIFQTFGANDEQSQALLDYSNSSFSPEKREAKLELPLADEPHLADWESYAQESKSSTVPETLSRYLVQLRFPIEEGISTTDKYRAATRRGDLSAAPGGLIWKAPDRITLDIHQTAGGRIPIIVIEDRCDFETMIRAIVRRNEPAEIPASMGAAAVKGLNNWSRVHKIKDEWIRAGADREGASWNQAFKSVNPSKADYQDTLIILSKGTYSNISADDVGCTEQEWLDKSLAIRMEHECAHYFCRRVYGSMHNNLRDELVADYAGIVGAEGHFRSDWFLTFMGLNETGEYDGEGRMKVYRGALDDDAWAIMGKLLVRAAKNVERADLKLESRSAPRPGELMRLSDYWLEELASFNEGQLKLS